MQFIYFATAFFLTISVCDLRLFVHMVWLQSVLIHNGIAHRNCTELICNPFMCDIAHTNASQSHHMNSLIDFHTTHFLSQSHSQKKLHCVKEPWSKTLEITEKTVRAHSHLATTTQIFDIVTMSSGMGCIVINVTVRIWQYKKHIIVA